MPRFGKADKQGRSSGIWSGRQGKNRRPPKGEPWTWLTRELLSSAAWRATSINCRRLIDFLLVEHMNHAGTENGNLAAPYDHLVPWGLTRSEIRRAIEEAEFLGLIRYQRGGRWAGSNQPSRYRLTFLPDRGGDAPTNDWKRRSEEDIKSWRERETMRRKTAKARKQNLKAGSRIQTTEVRSTEQPNTRHSD